MTDAKWNIEDGTLYWDDAGVMIVPWEHSLDVGNAYFPPAAVGALVQCIRNADRLATLVYALRDIHFDRNGYCNACGGKSPCATRRLADELAPTEDGGPGGS